MQEMRTFLVSLVWFLDWVLVDSFTARFLGNEAGEQHRADTIPVPFCACTKLYDIM